MRKFYAIESSTAVETGDDVVYIDLFEMTKDEDGDITPKQLDGYCSSQHWGVECLDSWKKWKDVKTLTPDFIHSAEFDTLEEAVMAFNDVKAGLGRPDNVQFGFNPFAIEVKKMLDKSKKAKTPGPLELEINTINKLYEDGKITEQERDDFHFAAVDWAVKKTELYGKHR